MARRRKSKALSTIQIITLIILLILLLLVKNSGISPTNIFKDIIIITLTPFTLGLIFLFWIQKQKQAKLRAINISQIYTMTGIEFEYYVGELLRFQGYKIEFTKPSHDFGVDIIAKKNNLKTAIQIKRRNDQIGRSAISDAVAGIAYYKCRQAMVITSSYFTKEAKELAKSNKCVLIDKDKLSNWIYNFQKNKEQPPTISKDI